MKAPIIFMHFGHSWYLEHTLKCARIFNPDTNIFLFGDDSNRDIAIQSGVIFDYYENYGGIGDYRKDFEDLKNNYTHIGSAPTAARLKHHFNIMRWPRLLDIMVDHSMNSCWYFDSDTIICRNLSEINMSNHYYTINHISGCATYINNCILLNKLCQIIYDHRNNKEFVKYHKEKILERKKEGKLYNLCDMSYIRVFKEKYKPYTKDLAWPRYTMREPSPSIFDWNISILTADQIKDYPFEFDMGSGKENTNFPNGKKKITFIDNIPYFTKRTKNSINPYYFSFIRANTLNMSWCNENFWIEILNNIGGI